MAKIVKIVGAEPKPGKLVVRINVTPPWWLPARSWFQRDHLARRAAMYRATGALLAHVLMQAERRGLGVHTVVLTERGIELDVYVPVDVNLMRVQQQARDVCDTAADLDPTRGSDG